jgi:bifunctional DNase/RNase
MVQVTVERLGFDQDQGQAVVILSDLSKSMLIPIWIRTLEATAIAIPLEGLTPPRPVTADILVSILDKLGVAVTMVGITEIKDEVFHAVMVLQKGAEEIEVDCRPSDAIAVALRKGAPLYVAEKVMAEAGIPASDASVQ